MKALLRNGVFSFLFTAALAGAARAETSIPWCDGDAMNAVAAARKAAAEKKKREAAGYGSMPVTRKELGTADHKVKEITSSAARPAVEGERQQLPAGLRDYLTRWEGFGREAELRGAREREAAKARVAQPAETAKAAEAKPARTVASKPAEPTVIDGTYRGTKRDARIGVYVEEMNPPQAANRVAVDASAKKLGLDEVFVVVARKGDGGDLASRQQLAGVAFGANSRVKLVDAGVYPGKSAREIVQAIAEKNSGHTVTGIFHEETALARDFTPIAASNVRYAVVGEQGGSMSEGVLRARFGNRADLVTHVDGIRPQPSAKLRAALARGETPDAVDERVAGVASEKRLYRRGEASRSTVGEEVSPATTEHAAADSTPPPAAVAAAEHVAAAATPPPAVVENAAANAAPADVVAAAAARGLFAGGPIPEMEGVEKLKPAERKAFYAKVIRDLKTMQLLADDPASKRQVFRNIVAAERFGVRDSANLVTAIQHWYGDQRDFAKVYTLARRYMTDAEVTALASNDEKRVKAVTKAIDELAAAPPASDNLGYYNVFQGMDAEARGRMAKLLVGCSTGLGSTARELKYSCQEAAQQIWGGGTFEKHADYGNVNLKKSTNLEEAKARYTALGRDVTLGTSVDDTLDVMRFVNPKDFIKASDRFHGEELYGVRNYIAWKDAKEFLDTIPAADFVPSIDMMKRVHETATKAMDPWLKRLDRVIPDGWVPDHGGVIKRRDSWGKYGLTNPLTEEQFKAIKDNTYLEGFIEVPLVSRPDKRVGWIHYAAKEKTVDKLNQLIDWYKANKETMDPVELAARFQYNFVSIHPFIDGNGRTSRLFLDKILESHGLPPAILKDTNNDILLPIEKYVQEVRDGVDRYLTIAEKKGFYQGAPNRNSGLGALSLGVTPNQGFTARIAELSTTGAEPMITADGKIFRLSAEDGMLYDVRGVPYVAHEGTIYPITDRDYRMLEMNVKHGRNSEEDSNRYWRVANAGMSPAHEKYVSDNIDLVKGIREGHVDAGTLKVEPYSTVDAANKNGELFLHAWQADAFAHAARIDATEPAEILRSAFRSNKTNFDNAAVAGGVIQAHDVLAHYEMVDRLYYDLEQVAKKKFPDQLATVRESRRKLHGAARELLAPYLAERAALPEGAAAILAQDRSLKLFDAYFQRSKLAHADYAEALRKTNDGYMWVLRSDSSAVNVTGFLSHGDFLKMVDRLPMSGKLKEFTFGLRNYMASQEGQLKIKRTLAAVQAGLAKEDSVWKSLPEALRKQGEKLEEYYNALQMVVSYTADKLFASRYKFRAAGDEFERRFISETMHAGGWAFKDEKSFTTSTKLMESMPFAYSANQSAGLVHPQISLVKVRKDKLNVNYGTNSFPGEYEILTTKPVGPWHIAEKWAASDLNKSVVGGRYDGGGQLAADPAVQQFVQKHFGSSWGASEPERPAAETANAAAGANGARGARATNPATAEHAVAETADAAPANATDNVAAAVANDAPNGATVNAAESTIAEAAPPPTWAAEATTPPPASITEAATPPASVVEAVTPPPATTESVAAAAATDGQASASRVAQETPRIELPPAQRLRAPSKELEGAIFMSTSSLEQNRAAISAKHPMAAPFLYENGPLGHGGVLGALSPMGYFSPASDARFRPAHYITGFDWSSEAMRNNMFTGPLSAWGIFGPDSVVGNAFYRHFLPAMPGGNVLREGDPLMVLGPKGLAGPYGSLGGAGPIGAHGFQEERATGRFLRHGREERDVQVMGAEGPTRVRLVENYTADYAAKLSRDHDLSDSFTVADRVVAGQSKEYNVKVRGDNWITFAATPRTLADRVGVEVLSQDGKVLAKSDSKGLVNFVSGRFPQDAEVRVRLTDLTNGPERGRSLDSEGFIFHAVQVPVDHTITKLDGAHLTQLDKSGREPASASKVAQETRRSDALSGGPQAAYDRAFAEELAYHQAREAEQAAAARRVEAGATPAASRATVAQESSVATSPRYQQALNDHQAAQAHLAQLERPPFYERWFNTSERARAYSTAEALVRTTGEHVSVTAGEQAVLNGVGRIAENRFTRGLSLSSGEQAKLKAAADRIGVPDLRASSWHEAVSGVQQAIGAWEGPGLAKGQKMAKFAESIEDTINRLPKDQRRRVNYMLGQAVMRLEAYKPSEFKAVSALPFDKTASYTATFDRYLDYAQRHIRGDHSMTYGGGGILSMDTIRQMEAHNAFPAHLDHDIKHVHYAIGHPMGAAMVFDAARSQNHERWLLVGAAYEAVDTLQYWHERKLAKYLATKHGMDIEEGMAFLARATDEQMQKVIREADIGSDIAGYRSQLQGWKPQVAPGTNPAGLTAELDRAVEMFGSYADRGSLASTLRYDQNPDRWRRRLGFDNPNKNYSSWSAVSQETVKSPIAGEQPLYTSYGRGMLERRNPAAASAVDYADAGRMALASARHEYLSGKIRLADLDKVNAKYGYLEGPVAGTSESARRLGYLRQEARFLEREEALARAEGDLEAAVAVRNNKAAIGAELLGAVRSRTKEVAGDSLKGRRERLEALVSDEAFVAYQNHFPYVSLQQVGAYPREAALLRSLHYRDLAVNAQVLGDARENLAKALQQQLATGLLHFEEHAQKQQGVQRPVSNPAFYRMANDVIAARAEHFGVTDAAELRSKMATTLKKQGWKEEHVKACIEKGICVPDYAAIEPAKGRMSPELAEMVMKDRFAASAGRDLDEAMSIARNPAKLDPEPYRTLKRDLDGQRQALVEQTNGLHGKPGEKSTLDGLNRAIEQVTRKRDVLEEFQETLERARPLSPAELTLQDKAVASVLDYLKSPASKAELGKIDGLKGKSFAAGAGAGEERFKAYDAFKKAVSGLPVEDRAKVFGFVRAHAVKSGELAAGLKKGPGLDPEVLGRVLADADRVHKAGASDPSFARALFRQANLLPEDQSLLDAIKATRWDVPSSSERGALASIEKKRVDAEAKASRSVAVKEETKAGRDPASASPPPSALERVKKADWIATKDRDEMVDALKTVEKGDAASMEERAAHIEALSKADPDTYDTYRATYVNAAELMRKDKNLDPDKAWELGMKKMLEGLYDDKAKVEELYQRTAGCLKRKG